MPTGVAFTYAPGRCDQYAEDILKGSTGTPQVEGYAGYNRLLKHQGNTIRLAYSWAHARRKLFEIAKSDKATPITDGGITQIRALYQIERGIRGQNPAERMAAMQERSKPKFKQMEIWLQENRACVSAKSPIGEALKYITKNWPGLVEFLDDGRVEVESNTVERTIRPIALNRKNALFAVRDAGTQNWAMLASLIETSKLNSVDPHAWLTATLQAIINGHKKLKIDELMLWSHCPTVCPGNRLQSS